MVPKVSREAALDIRVLTKGHEERAETRVGRRHPCQRLKGIREELGTAQVCCFVESPCACHVHMDVPVGGTWDDHCIEARDLRDAVDDEAALRSDTQRRHTKAVVERAHGTPQLQKEDDGAGYMSSEGWLV